MKQFVKALPTVEDCFKYLILAFPGLSIENIKASVSDGPQIRHLIGTMSELQLFYQSI